MIIEERTRTVGYKIKLVLKIARHFQLCLLSLFLDCEAQTELRERRRRHGSPGEPRSARSSVSVVVKFYPQHRCWASPGQATKLFFQSQVTRVINVPFLNQ